MAEAQPMTEAMYYVLLALLRPEHGYGIMQHIRELSGGRLVMGPGTLYGVLTKLRKDGLILLADEDERRKTYILTEKGEAALRDEYARLKRLVADGAELEVER